MNTLDINQAHSWRTFSTEGKNAKAAASVHFLSSLSLVRSQKHFLGCFFSTGDGNCSCCSAQPIQIGDALNSQHTLALSTQILEWIPENTKRSTATSSIYFPVQVSDCSCCFCYCTNQRTRRCFKSPCGSFSSCKCYTCARGVTLAAFGSSAKRLLSPDLHKEQNAHWFFYFRC